MSILTKVLKLFCYDPETDGANTFNIPKALNENWEKIDQLVLLAVAAAAAYDSEGSYAVGDYCTHGGGLHKCSTPIDGGEEWNAEHWTETSVANQLVRSLLQLDYSLEDVSNPPKKPFFMVSKITGATGLPSWWPAGRNTFIRFCAVDSQYAFDVAANYTNKRDAFRLLNDGSWFEFVTTTSPEEISLPLSAGVQASTLHGGYKCVFSKDQCGKVYITLGVQGNFINGQSIFTLPEDCRPNGNVVINSYVNGYSSFLEIGTDGIGKIYTDVTAAEFSNIYASGVFYAAQ